MWFFKISVHTTYCYGYNLFNINHAINARAILVMLALVIKEI